MEWLPYLGEVPPVDRAGLAKMEADLGISLPKPYVDDLIAHQGEAPAEPRIAVGKGEASFGPLLYVGGQFEDENYKYSVEGGLEAIEDWRGDEPAGKTDFWPFGSDYASGYFCFDNRGDAAGEVVFLYLAREPDDARAILPVADSYDAFMKALS